MTESRPVQQPPDELPSAAHRAAQRLAYAYSADFTHEQVDALYEDSYRSLAATAVVQTYLPALAERLTKERPDATAQADGHMTKSMREVLFLCGRNAGRSEIAAA